MRAKFVMVGEVDEPSVPFEFDGRALGGRRGETVAAALLRQGVSACRRTVSGDRLRGPYCMMGVCFECLVEIDGGPPVRACQVRVEPGMRVSTAYAAWPQDA